MSKTREYPSSRKKTPDFARYVGTSCWRKHKRRVRAYARFLAAKAAAEPKATP